MRRCSSVLTGNVVSPLRRRRSAILIDQFRTRAVLGDMDAIAYVDSGDESNDEDFAARVYRQLVMLNRIWALGNHFSQCLV